MHWTVYSATRSSYLLKTTLTSVILIISMKIGNIKESLALSPSYCLHNTTRISSRMDLLHSSRYPSDLELIRFSAFSDIMIGH